MFSSVLIANRGEIAVRIMRSARRLGLRTIAVYSEADRDALHVAEADDAMAIGPPPARESYLDIERVLAAARESGAESIHPGYGFLAENADFAHGVAEAGLTFIGPTVEAIRLMGQKDEAKALMRKAGVPVVPGFEGSAQDVEALTKVADEIGYPLMIKAVAGGGGRGMRRVEESSGFAQALEGARREAKSAFGDERVLVERFLDRPRHVEVQVFADTHGGTVHLFERECSLQRRQQKIIEEAPAPGMSAGLRQRMTAAAIAAAEAVGYVGAGTVEFLVEGGPLSEERDFYFLEMNTRLQVEHPVTEAITGTDLVEWQFRIAAGEPLPLDQQRIRLSGHAIEARLYAEDPAKRFMPSAAHLSALDWPEPRGIRIDTGFRTGDTVSPFYDPMLAKLVAHGRTRGEAVTRLRRALNETFVAGPKTNLHFMHALLGREDVMAGRLDTGLVEREQSALLPEGVDLAAVRIGAEALLTAERAEIEKRRGAMSNDTTSPWSRSDAFCLGPREADPRVVLCQGEPYDVAVVWSERGPRVSLAGGNGADEGPELPCRLVPTRDGVVVIRAMRQWDMRLPDMTAAEEDAAAKGGEIRAPMHGKIARLYVEEGARVGKGDRIAILEAMKMEHVLLAPHDGVVESIATEEGAQIAEDAPVAVISGTGGG